MSIIEKLKDEHVELRRIADELDRLMAGADPCDLTALARCRWRLVRLVTQHLALEDRQIYSRAPDPASPLGSIAARLKGEIGDLYDSFRGHITAWPSEAIVADWETYRTETRRLLATLHARIDREERELYPLVVDGDRPSASKAA